MIWYYPVGLIQAIACIRKILGEASEIQDGVDSVGDLLYDDMMWNL